jgi:hypothetical protein
MSYIHDIKQLHELDSDFADVEEEKSINFEEVEEEEEEEVQKLDERSQRKPINLIENGRMRSFKAAVPSENIIINDTYSFNAADSKIAINIMQTVNSNPNVTIKINLNKRNATECININIE